MRYIFTRKQIAEVRKKCREFLKTSPYAKDVVVMYFRLIPFQNIEEGDTAAKIALYFNNEKIEDRYKQLEYRFKIQNALINVLGDEFADAIKVSALTLSSLRTKIFFKEKSEEINDVSFIRGKKFFFANITWM